MKRLLPVSVSKRYFVFASSILRAKLHVESFEMGAITPFWVEQLNRINRPSALNLAKQLVPTNSLGFPGAVDLSDLSRNTSRMRIVDIATAWKRMHEDMVVLVRLGDFYETWGIDAVMLVQYAGLNPMGDSCRAGCPKGNIQQTLNSLTDAGLSAAVYEEVNVAGSRSKIVRKERYLSQIVTPGRPVYLYETSLKTGEIPYRLSKPYALIRCSGPGCCVGYVHVDSGSVTVTESITEEALVSSIESVGGVAEPVYLSVDTSARLSRIRAMVGVSTKTFPISISFDSLLTTICTDLNNKLALAHPFRRVLPALDAHTSMKPLHANTADFLGLLHTRSNSPNLVSFLISSESPNYMHLFFKSWLLCPPPVEIVECMRSLLASLASTHQSIPRPIVIPIDKLVRLLDTGNGNVFFFREIVASANALITAPPVVTEFCVWKIATHYAGMSVPEMQVRAQSVVDQIAKCVVDSPCVVHPAWMAKFIESNESELAGIDIDYSLLIAARTALIDAINRSLVAPEKSLKFDQLSSVLYVKDPNVSLRPEAKKRPLIGDSRKRVSTDLIVRAEESYKTAVFTAKENARFRLKTLCKEICKETLILLTHWSVVVSCALAHLEHGLRNGWVHSHTCTTPLHTLNEIWPYWLGKAESVSNTIVLGKHSMVLTAPNQSGKSTLIRSVGAVVLLGNCGLLVPAAVGTKIPEITNLLIVSPNGDRPMERTSAFAAEADAMGSALRSVENALLLVDEFGRGTSGKDASALSVAILAWLQNYKVTTIWATHLHELFTLLPNAYNWMQMEGYRLVDGKCLDSKGVETAQERGFPEEIIKNALLIKKAKPSVTTPIDTCTVKRIHTTRMPDTEMPVEVPTGSQLPPVIQSGHIVYILRFDEQFYIGETQNFAQRLKSHTKRFKKQPHQVWYLQQPNRSKARSVETLMIQMYQREGIPLLSSSDGKNTHSFSAN